MPRRFFQKNTWNDLHLQIIWYGREYSPARGWDLEKDIITKTIGRKTVLNEYYKKNTLKIIKNLLKPRIHKYSELKKKKKYRNKLIRIIHRLCRFNFI